MEALSKQTLSQDYFEIIIVYDPLDPFSNDILEIGKNHGANLVQCSKKGVAKNRNYGAEFAKSDILGFIDDDSIPSPDWAKAVVKAFENPNVGILGGLIIPKKTFNSSSNIFADNLSYSYTSKKIGAVIFDNKFQSLRFSSRYDSPFFAEIDTPMGCNMAVRRRLFELLGGFAFLPFREETELAIRAKKAGKRIVFVPEAAVIHTWEESGRIRNYKKLLISDSYLATAAIYREFYWNGETLSLLKFIVFTPLPTREVIREALHGGQLSCCLRILATVRGFLSLIIGIKMKVNPQ